MAATTASTSEGTKPVLSLRGISKTFGAVAALTDVDLDVAPGEVMALVGDNGAGKSTLVKVLAGVHAADSGTITFEGREVTIHTPADAQALGIATVYQDLALCENLDVVANLFLGQELGNGAGVHLLDETSMEHRALELLDSIGVTTIRSVRIEVASLSGGQRQAVSIARSLLGDPKVVLLDEPTAALGIIQTREILKLIDRLRERGLGVVVISHNLANVFEVADRIAVLRLGRMAATFDTREASQEEVVGAITGAEFGGDDRPTEEKPL
jgi:D-xylose transport system ATP-binding protein